MTSDDQIVGSLSLVVAGLNQNVCIKAGGIWTLYQGIFRNDTRSFFLGTKISTIWDLHELWIFCKRASPNLILKSTLTVKILQSSESKSNATTYERSWFEEMDSLWRQHRVFRYGSSSDCHTGLGTAPFEWCSYCSSVKKESFQKPLRYFHRIPNKYPY